MQIFPKTHYNFIGWRWKFFAFSGLLLGGSLVSLATRGAKYGIDFTGGTILEITFEKPIELAQVRAAVEKSGLPNASIQHYSGTSTFAIRVQDINQSAEQLEKEMTDIQSAINDNKFRVDSKSFVGPSVSRNLFQQALLAIAVSLFLCIFYLAFRFANPIWGVSGIIALLHDVLATYGLFSILGLEVDMLIISALLTIGCYSIHDTIVIFDRMREKMGVMRNAPLDQVINESMNETLSRTIITSGTVLVAVLILYFFGGEVIHHFALALVFGTLVGTYSSIAVAAPLVYEWTLRHSKGRAARVQAAASTAKPQAITKPVKKNR